MVSRAKQHIKGFTLIEVCVVLVIVAIITAMASLAFYRANAQRGMVALTTFARSILSMREQTILRQQSLGMYLTADGYHIYEIHMKPNGSFITAPIPNSSFHTNDAFAHRWQLQVTKGVFMSKNSDGTETQDSDKPILAVSPDGQITPIQFTFGPHVGDPWWSVTIKGSGQYKIKDLRN